MSAELPVDTPAAEQVLPALHLPCTGRTAGPLTAPARVRQVRRQQGAEAAGGSQTNDVQAPSRRTSADYLRALRRAQLQRATSTHPDEMRVAVYVLVAEHGDPGPRLTAATAFAARQRWTVVDRAVDVTGPTDPALRPRFARLLAAARGGEIHGIVAVSRVDISDGDREYEVVLRRIQALGAGLALTREETFL